VILEGRGEYIQSWRGLVKERDDKECAAKTEGRGESIERMSGRAEEGNHGILKVEKGKGRGESTRVAEQN
jgi:hypothetical protein